MADITEQEVHVNIYESDDEEKSKTPNSRSPNVTRSLLSQEKDDSPIMQEIELKVVGGTKNVIEMNRFELEQKYLHFKRTSEQYEKLYSEYLEKYILSKREKEMLVFRQRRVNYWIGKYAYMQAKWDSFNHQQRKLAISVGALVFILIIILAVFM